MSRQYFEDLVADPQIANSTALVATTIEALWPAAIYSRIEANSVTSAPKIFKIHAGGIWSTGASGTMILTPSIGTATGGATLGASATVTVPVSITNIAWYLEATFVIRTVGSGGTMMGTGCFWSGGLTTNASPGANTVIPFGGTSATFDTTAAPAASAGAITIAKTLSVAGSVTPMYAFMQTVN
jgi:hypothetical protein